MATVKELHGSGKLSFTSKGLQGERLWHVLDYSELVEFMVQLSGAVKIDGDGNIARFPQQEFAPSSGLWCVSATSEGIGKSSQDANGLITWDGGAKVTARYETLPYDPKKNPEDEEDAEVFATENFSITAEMLVLEPKTEDGEAVWEYLDADGAPDGNAVPIYDAPELLKIVPQLDYRITRHKVPRFSKSTFFSLLGTVNDDTFGECEPETLLFMGVDSSKQTMTDGTRSYELTLSFQYKPTGWNKIFNKETGEFQGIWHHYNERKPYTPASFNALMTA